MNQCKRHNANKSLPNPVHVSTGAIKKRSEIKSIDKRSKRIC